MAFSFLFPGQGSQYTCMFKEHFEEFDEFQENLSLAEEFYKEELKNIIFQEDPRLNDTYYTQPLLMLMSYSLFQVWKKHNCPLPKVAAGQNPSQRLHPARPIHSEIHRFEFSLQRKKRSAHDYQQTGR